MSSRDFGLGPKWWQQPENKLKKCSERFSKWCDPTETDGCCAVIPCMYCLELEFYGEPVQHGETEFSTNGWAGTVGGGSFFGFWEVGYESGECEFVVYWQGAEVYRKSCQQGQSCRDSSDEVEVVINYEDATLRWVKHEYRPLPYIQDPDTDCTIHFCGDCECTCECLCVILTEPDGTQYREEFCDSFYDDCLAPIWEGVIEYLNVRITLGRDSYTSQCLLFVNVDGEDFDPIPIENCTALSGSVILPNYSVLSFSCKVCGCEEPDSCPCCPGWPERASGSISWSSVVVPSDCTDGGGSEPVGDFSCPLTGDEEGVLLRQDATFLRVRLFCDPETLGWKAQYRSAISGGGFEQPISSVWADATEVEFICPDCANAVGGQATGQVDFIARMACETSGGVTEYNVLVHGEVTIGCP